MSPSLAIYDVVVTPQSAIGLLAQLGSLAGTVIVLGKVVMNLVERMRPKPSCPKAAASCCTWPTSHRCMRCRACCSHRAWCLKSDAISTSSPTSAISLDSTVVEMT